jgi:RecB family exonuclease
MTFLEKIANEILSKYKNEISDLCIVFPSRRAGIYFKNILSKKLDSPVWSPSVYSIEDFVQKLSPYNVIDNLTLVFELFRVYESVKAGKKMKMDDINSSIDTYEDSESFDNFYQWGHMLLKDFDIVDKSLADTKTLFKNIKSSKEIEEIFPIELREDFLKFWGSVFLTGGTPAKKNFVKIWKLLGEVYDRFKESLASQNLAYEGMAIRKLCEDLISGTVNLRWRKVIFAGFSSLNKCEEKIISYLMKTDITDVFWDVDNYYIEDEKQEAGKFIRKNLKTFAISKESFKSDTDNLNLEKGKKNISVIGSPLPIGMVKTFGSVLNDFIKQDNFLPEKTAVILPDENLLLPVLYSLPGEVKELNVTMGLPFVDTPLFTFVQLLKDLQENYKIEKGGITFHHKDVERLLMHPYIKFLDTAFAFNFVRDIKEKNIARLSVNYILSRKNRPLILETVFKIPNSPSEAYEYLTIILDCIMEKIENDNSQDTMYKNFQLEYIYNFYTNLNLLNDVINKYKREISIQTYWKLLIEVLSSVSIPFTGEPLKGLQVMGLLESRSIDFENVFILSMNEGILPSGNSHNSFIPYALRKAFGMPTFEDSDAISAYYFYRLLQRAKNIFLFYDTEVSVNTKEKSRFMLQIENELVNRNPNIKYSQKIIAPSVNSITHKPIVIEKNSDVLDKIKNLKHLSATDFTTYINCSLQFYFKKIAEIEEPKEVEEYYSPATLGSIVHDIMMLLYTPYINTELNKEILENIVSDFENGYDETFKKSLKNTCGNNFEPDDSGRNILLKSVIKKLVKRILENDIDDSPFKITGLEMKIDGEITTANGDKVKLFGKIDRVDEKNSVTNILDYKTGTIKMKKIDENNKNEFFNEVTTDIKYKENFQVLFYSYLYKKKNLVSKINAGIYSVKNIKKGITMFSDNFIEETDFNEFENKLIELTSGMYNPLHPFVQTEELKNCEYCSYKEICNR